MRDGAEQIEAAERNYRDAWRFLIERVDGGEVVETDRLVLLTLPLPIAYFNSAFVKPTADPVSCLDEVQAFYGARERPFTIRFREQDASAIESAGLVPDGSSPLMVADIAGIAPPEHIEVRKVDSSSWDDHVTTAALGFGMPREVVASIFGPALAASDGYVGFNALAHDTVASTAALLVTGDIAGIYNVATPEPFRRRGLGEATTRAAVVEGARRGCTIATLQSSAMGYPIYERMGFRTVVRWLAYTG